jgi:hypothetical protein
MEESRGRRKHKMKYEILDHGVKNPQYFQGCGTSFTKFDNVVTGIGASYKEALGDAIDSMAQSLPNGIEIPAELTAEYKTADDTITIPALEDDDDGDSELWYHVSIRWSLDSPEYSVIVGNLGTVYTGRDKVKAYKNFVEYVEQSKSAGLRVSGEDVTMTEDGEPIQEFTESLSESEEV